MIRNIASNGSIEIASRSSKIIYYQELIQIHVQIPVTTRTPDITLTHNIIII
jgi:hypothetical protein